jgi:hypothetical protein
MSHGALGAEDALRALWFDLFPLVAPLSEEKASWVQVDVHERPTIDPRLTDPSERPTYTSLPPLSCSAPRSL